jgi:hypothetical protein
VATRLNAVCGVAAALVGWATVTTAETDPFQFLSPGVVVTPAERSRLAAGETIVRSLPAVGGEVATFVATRTTADGDRLAAWVRDISALKQGPGVLAIARFSDPPRLADLHSLSLDRAEIDELAGCRPDGCSVKLSGAEIAVVQRAVSGRGSTAVGPVAVDALRAIILARVERYIGTDDAVPPALPGFIGRTPFLSARVPLLASSLGHPRSPLSGGVERFLYWSKERYTGKATITASEVSLYRGATAGEPEMLVASTQLFATHYADGALNLTMVLAGRDASGRVSERYLAALNRTQVDMLGGVFGPMKRWVGERNVRREAVERLDDARRRIESGPPSR